MTSPALTAIVNAVLEKLSTMPRKYPAHRRPPRPYTKQLKGTSKGVPTVVFPPGPVPDEPWVDLDEDEAFVPLIGDAVKLYHAEHTHRTKMSKYQADRSIGSFLTSTKLHENMPLWVITREACKGWRVELVTSMTQAAPERKPVRGRIAGAGTLQKRIKSVQHWLAWCVDRDWLSVNPMAGLTLPTRLVSASKQTKVNFTDEELAKIIPALLALPADDLPRTEFKWAVLALMFSGARCMEICQLRPQDIRQVEGHWIYDIKTVSGEHRVKNDPSKRLLPIHSQLQSLGFLDWVQRQQGERLFPAMFRKGSPLVSMWFARILKRLGIKRKEVSLHCTRHTMTVKLMQARTYPPLQNRLLGHAIGKSVEERSYATGLTFTVKELSEAIEKVRYPIPT